MHAVFTLQDSLCTGGMTYLPQRYATTVETVIALHKNGQRLSNADYPNAHLIIFHLVGYYWKVLKTDGFILPKNAVDEWEIVQRRLMLRGTYGTNIYAGPDGCSDLPPKQLYAVIQRSKFCIWLFV